MKAAEVYTVLEAGLGPLLTQHGFRKRRSGRLAFQRKVGTRYQTVWFEMDKWGWDPHAGSKFFVNFTVSDSPTFDVGALRDERLNSFLTDAELVRARGYRDAVVARIPRPPESYFEKLEAHFIRFADGAGMMAAVRAEFEPAELPYRRNQDFGLRYWQPADVEGWASFIAPILPRVIDDMDSWPLPPLPAGR
jgi:hypothetical protein